MASPVASWDRVGDRFYRKERLYSAVFENEKTLENCTVVGAPYGGAIAIYCDHQQISLATATQPKKPQISIYSASGKLIRHLTVDRDPIRGIGWIEDEQLVIITEGGVVRRYRSFDNDFDEFTLGNGAEFIKVRDCRFWSRGFVARLTNNTLIAVSDLDEPRPRPLAALPDAQVSAWALIAPANSSSRTVEVFLSLNNTVFVVDPTTAEDRGLDSGPFQRISVSPNGKFAGLYTADNKLWVVTSDFQNKLSEYDSRSKEPPLDVQWCANSAVVLAWEDEIHVVGPNGAAVKYFFDDPVFLLPDLDGIRLLTKGTCDFLQRVPDATEEIFKPGSTSPAAVLLDALEELNNKSPKADDIIQLIKPNLSEAVDLCIQAAGQEFDVKWQKVLLKAASFGKSTLELYDSDDFVEMTDTLRVLNAVRFYEIGLTLSYDQYLHLNPSRLIRRLLNRSQYLLAFRLADFLGLSSDSVYMHWAGQKAKHASGDEQAISKSIVRKLQGRKGVSFEAIARAAWIEGRGRLATELLGHEPRAHKQIPLLMQMQEDELALDRAIEGGDTDLMFYVLLALKKKMALPAFFRLVCERPVALAVVQASAREDDTEFLKDLYYQDDRRLEGASILMLDSVQQSETQAKVDKLKNAENLLKDNSKEFSFELKAIDEQTRLLKMQEAFDKDRPRSRAAATAATADARPSSSSAAVQLDSEPYTGQSLDRTLYNLLRTNQPKRAQRLIAEFKMPDRSTTWLRLRALIARRDWRELDEWTRSLKKAPVVGWEVFFDECLSAGNARLAAGFIPRCAGVGVEERAGMWVKCGLVGRGAEEALKAKDAKMLETLAGVVGGREGKDIERMLGQLKSRR